MTDLNTQTTQTTDAVERLINTMEIIRETSGISPHTTLSKVLKEAQTFLTAQRRLILAHHTSRRRLIQELHKVYPEGLPYELANAVHAEVEL